MDTIPGTWNYTKSPLQVLLGYDYRISLKSREMKMACFLTMGVVQSIFIVVFRCTVEVVIILQFYETLCCYKMIAIHGEKINYCCCNINY